MELATRALLTDDTFWGFAMHDRLVGAKSSTVLTGRTVLTLPEDPIELHKLLASTLDLLVRNSRTQLAQIGGVAQRVLQLWQAAGDIVLELTPETMEVGGEVIFECQKELGDWLLPAFMVGIRKVALRPSASADDFIGIGVELGLLQIDAVSMSRFRDWIWSEGAEGLDILMQRSFIEVIEVMDSRIGSPRNFGTSHAVGMMTPLGTSTLAVDARDLMVAALRPEFQLSVDLFAQGLEYRGFEAPPRELERLRSACDDSTLWMLLETDAVLSHKELRGALSPARVARRVIDRVNAGVTVRLLNQLARIYSSEDAFVRNMIRNLNAAGIGYAVGAGVNLSDRIMRGALTGLLRVMSAAQAETICRSLLASTTPHTPRWTHLVSLVKELGVEVWREFVNEPELEHGDATLHAELLQDVGISARAMADVLARIDQHAAATVIKDIPESFLIELESLIRGMLRTAPRTTIEHVVPALLDRRLIGIVFLIADVLTSKHKLDWSRKTLHMICSHIDLHGLSSRFLVPLVRDTRADLKAREAALDVIVGNRDDELTSAAIKWRMSELFDPPELRERLILERKKLKVHQQINARESEDLGDAGLPEGANG